MGHGRVEPPSQPPSSPSPPPPAAAAAAATPPPSPPPQSFHAAQGSVLDGHVLGVYVGWLDQRAASQQLVLVRKEFRLRFRQPRSVGPSSPRYASRHASRPASSRVATAATAATVQEENVAAARLPERASWEEDDRPGKPFGRVVPDDQQNFRRR